MYSSEAAAKAATLAAFVTGKQADIASSDQISSTDVYTIINNLIETIFQINWVDAVLATDTFDLTGPYMRIGSLPAGTVNITISNPLPYGYIKLQGDADAPTLSWPASFDWGTPGAPASDANPANATLIHYIFDTDTYYATYTTGFSW